MARIVDEHMYEACGLTCRLQIFTSGQRSVPVAVVTQYSDVAGSERGTSLTNAAERLATAVWQEFLPGRRRPPSWVEHYTPAPEAATEQLAKDDWYLVTFKSRRRRRQLFSPSWRYVGQPTVNELVGEHVDPSRGARYEPPPPPDAKWIDVFQTTDVTTFPPTRPFRTDGCMEEALRGSARETNPGSCCWYHAGSWHEANHLAVACLIAAAKEYPTGRDDLIDDALARTSHGATRWLIEAAESLLRFPIVYSDHGWTNGQHRAQAMIDQRVDRALVDDIRKVNDLLLPDRIFRDAADSDIWRRIEAATT